MEGDESREIFGYEDVDKAFERSLTVKYNQVITLPENSRRSKGIYICFSGRD